MKNLKKIEINEKKFIVQAYEDRYVSLSELDNGDIPFDKKIGSLSINIQGNKPLIDHSGKSNKESEKFLNELDVAEVFELLRKIM